MIEINLLPEELRPKEKKLSFSIESDRVLNLVILGFGTLLLIHLALAVAFIVKNYQSSMLQNRWRILEPQRKVLEEAKKEYAAFSEDAKLIGQLDKQRINWSEKLNKLSLNLPVGVWFNEFTLSQKDFILRCSVISPKKEEMSLINKFIDNLKNDPAFFKGFKAMELNSVKIRSVASYEITDFILTGLLKK